ncbi:hypothetical protein DXT97_12615 [Agrobacterium tumefaciens]|uniref:hypothetical protein n=1 Tax=Agrobacterium tumefaciens TaxID=358 RepID=UPI0004724613|nr:hypothetical protein [Agrobacterium tumefaciens]MQB37635.1 hypothetical protein [Agrobacterium tumefaciens]
MAIPEAANKNNVEEKANAWEQSYPRRELKSGGDGGNNGGMDGRIAKLEADMEYVKRDVSELRTDMRDVRDRAVKIEERMATKTFVFSVYGIVSALIAAITLFQGQIQQFLGIATGTQ